jgi:hypothetical protein
MAQEVRVVIVGYGTRIVNAKTVEGVSEGGCCVDRLLSILEGEVFDGCCFGVRACFCVEEGDIVCGYQR